MAYEFQRWAIDARLSNISFGRIQPNSSLRLQYGIEQLRRPARSAAEVHRQSMCVQLVRVAHYFEQPAGLRFVYCGEAAQTEASLLMVPHLRATHLRDLIQKAGAEQIFGNWRSTVAFRESL